MKSYMSPEKSAGLYQLEWQDCVFRDHGSDHSPKGCMLHGYEGPCDPYGPDAPTECPLREGTITVEGVFGTHPNHQLCVGCGATWSHIREHGHDRAKDELACPEACTCVPQHFSMRAHQIDLETEAHRRRLAEPWRHFRDGLWEGATALRFADQESEARGYLVDAIAAYEKVLGARPEGLSTTALRALIGALQELVRAPWPLVLSVLRGGVAKLVQELTDDVTAWEASRHTRRGVL